MRTFTLKPDNLIATIQSGCLTVPMQGQIAEDLAVWAESKGHRVTINYVPVDLKFGDFDLAGFLAAQITISDEPLVVEFLLTFSDLIFGDE